MKTTEAAYLAAFIEVLGDRLGNDGSNDMTIPDTLLNRDFVKAVQKFCGQAQKIQLSHDKKKIITNNGCVLSYLSNKFMQQYGIMKKNLPTIFS